jgi:hypothetical protein
MRTEVISQATLADLELWDKRVTARVLGISPKTLNRWLTNKCGPKGFKVGGQVRFRPRDVAAYIDSCATIGGGAAA